MFTTRNFEHETLLVLASTLGKAVRKVNTSSLRHGEVISQLQLAVDSSCPNGTRTSCTQGTVFFNHLQQSAAEGLEQTRFVAQKERIIVGNGNRAHVDPHTLGRIAQMSSPT